VTSISKQIIFLQLSIHREDINSNRENIGKNKENIIIHKGFIDRNYENIQTNTKDIDTNIKDIATNRKDIDTNREDIDTNKQNIYTNNKDIIKNKQDIQLLSDSFKRSTLKFHANTHISKHHWADHVRVTYEYELVDTHGAFNPGTGTFTAPFVGSYGFIFYAHFDSNDGTLYYYLNDNYFPIYHQYGSNFDMGATVYLALNLTQGDRVWIDSGNAWIWPNWSPASFMGFLLQ
jgi:hypothetical protein